MKEQFTSLEIIEFLFGRISPGSDQPENTISIFKSDGPYQSQFGKRGILGGAVGYLHTQRPIDRARIRGTITGICDDFREIRQGRATKDILRESAW